MRITLTDTTAFVVTFRNELNSEFYIRSKKDFERELELGEDSFVVSVMTEGVRSEADIITMINEGIAFYTYCYSKKEFTEVNVVDGNLRSVANETKEDNIEGLPLLRN